MARPKPPPYPKPPRPPPEPPRPQPAFEHFMAPRLALDAGDGVRGIGGKKKRPGRMPEAETGRTGLLALPIAGWPKAQIM
jgi:hypothetical protein